MCNIVFILGLRYILILHWRNFFCPPLISLSLHRRLHCHFEMVLTAEHEIHGGGVGSIQIQLLPPYIHLNLTNSAPWSLNPPLNPTLILPISTPWIVIRLLPVDLMFCIAIEVLLVSLETWLFLTAPAVICLHYRLSFWMGGVKKRIDATDVHFPSVLIIQWFSEFSPKFDRLLSPLQILK